MKNEEINNGWLQEQWCINLNWYDANGCSFVTLAQDYLCLRCLKRLKKEAKPDDIIKTVSACCSKKDDFIRADMPVMSSVFRYFLANGNQPVELETLSQELSERRGTTAGASPEILRRLLINDRYYGIRTLTEEAKIKTA
jgi:hypothetical protein